jgi:transitional endoplasmic reticulum ATPase
MKKSKRTADTAEQQLGWYMRNCVLSPVAGRLESVLLERLKYLKGIYDEEDDYPDLPKAKAHSIRLRKLRHALKGYSTPGGSKESFEQNALFARDEFGLDTIDTEILLLLLRYQRNSYVESFLDDVCNRLNSLSRALAALIGVDTREAHRRILPDGVLHSGGILSINDEAKGASGPGGYLQIAPPLRTIMFRPYNSREEWAAAMFGQPLAPSLAWEDFEHLGCARDLAARVLAGVGKSRAKGINLLLHGPVGTGKTEFCKTLAAKTGMAIWSIGEIDDNGGEPLRYERLASLRLAQRLLASRANSMVLFDEAEDLLEQPGGSFQMPMMERPGSKVHINRVLEQNPVPVIWTCNNVEFIDPAILRRMTLAIEIKTPNQPVRARIWRRVLTDKKLDLDEAAVRRLSGRYEAPPAIVANAARAAVFAGGGESDVEEAMGGVLQILGIGPRIADADGRDFDPHLVNCQENVSHLVERLARPAATRNWSLCLYGSSGTGKSQFARYLAERLGLEVMQQRASDLLSKYLGDSEKRIAAAFATARAQRLMLVIDEADSLLSDRRHAMRSWEVTQVNEMLTWMESHPVPFICTTNLVEQLDPASLRRFTFKLRFDPLSPTQAARAFEHFFGSSAPILLPEGLTPGDFATVRRKCELFGTADARLLVNWLEQEVEAKGSRSQAIGFVASQR